MKRVVSTSEEEKICISVMFLGVALAKYLWNTILWTIVQLQNKLLSGVALWRASTLLLCWIHPWGMVEEMLNVDIWMVSLKVHVDFIFYRGDELNMSTTGSMRMNRTICIHCRVWTMIIGKHMPVSGCARVLSTSTPCITSHKVFPSSLQQNTGSWKNKFVMKRMDLPLMVFCLPKTKLFSKNIFCSSSVKWDMKLQFQMWYYPYGRGKKNFPVSI